MAFEIENGVLKKYTEEQGVTEVVIPDSVTSIGYEAFYKCSSLKSVTIGNSVTSIGDWAFYDCSSLTEINIPDSVTSIGDSAFSWCSNLTEINIPNSVTSIGDRAFYGTKWLKNYPDDLVIINGILIEYKGSENNVVIPDSVTSIGDSAFSWCSNLTEIKIPNSVTSIGDRAFSRCSSLTEIKIPNSVTSIGKEAFYDCSSLTEINIPDSVTSIGDRAFEYCKSLTEIKIPDSVTSIGDSAFYNCSSLESIEVSENNENYASFDGVLYNKEITKVIHCPKAKKKVIIPDSVTSIGYRDFEKCNLKEITFRNITVPFYATHADITRDVKDVIKMIKNKDFSTKVPTESKYGMACGLFNQNPDDEETFAYIKKNFLKIFKFAIDGNNTEFATKVAEQGKLITKKNIDKLIDYARDKKRLEMSVILMNYKNEHFGFDDPLKDFRL